MTNNTIPITVLMSVYNGENHLEEAIESILNQTFRNFEFIIIDDGSEDKSLTIINNYYDNRISLLIVSLSSLIFSTMPSFVSALSAIFNLSLSIFFVSFKAFSSFGTSNPILLSRLSSIFNTDVIIKAED